MFNTNTPILFKIRYIIVSVSPLSQYGTRASRDILIEYDNYDHNFKKQLSQKIYDLEECLYVPKDFYMGKWKLNIDYKHIDSTYFQILKNTPKKEDFSLMPVITC